MKPALSVIFFTVLSGAGYGLWCLLGIALAIGIYPATANVLVPLAFGFVLVTTGLLASTLHLGRPERAWRALTQWRSSWLSREGIASLATYLPMLAVSWYAYNSDTGPAIRIAGAVLALCAFVTVWCTANIYRSLKTIRAWRSPLVLPLYFAFALLSGGLWLWSWLGFSTGNRVAIGPSVALVVLAALAALAKVAYWRALDRAPANTAGHATGLESLGSVRVFESPATEESYLTREMAFVLARKHSRRLRLVAGELAFALPILALILARVLDTGWLVPLAAASCLAGLFVERWLFFAQARHAVAAYFSR